MTAFVTIAAVFMLAAIGFLLRPLLKRDATAGADRALVNRDIYRDQLAEIERDVRAGVLDEQQAGQARQEVERRVLEEGAGVPEPAGAKPGRALPAALAVLLPVVAVALYAHLGNLQGLDAERHAASDLSSITPEQFETMTQKLAARMEQSPDDATGWTMLGRAYRAMDRHEEAARAFGRAAALKPDDADLLADQAEALGLAAGRSLEGEPTRLLDRALKLQPDHTKALALAGSAAFERDDYAAAIRHWERLLRQPDLGPEATQALQAGIEEARDLVSGKIPAAAPAVGRVSGTVSLDASLGERAAPEDTVFVFARAAQGPRMPLAIARVKVRDLPYHFALDDTMAMTPELKISAFSGIVVAARVSKSGNAVPSAGDLEGMSKVVKPGAKDVNVSIDQVVKQP